MRRPKVYSEGVVTTVNMQHWDGVFVRRDPSKPPKLIWWRDGMGGTLLLANKCACHPGMAGCPTRAYLDSAARHLRDVVDR